MKKWVAILLTTLGVLLLALGIICIIQCVWLYKLEYNTQLAEIGYYKEDIHILAYRYQLMGTLVTIGAVVGLIAGAVVGGMGAIGIADNNWRKY